MELMSGVISVLVVLAVFMGVRQWGHLRFKKAFEAAQAALQAQDYETAERHLRQCAKRAPLAVPIRATFGGVLARNGKLEEAEEQMKLAAELQPRNAEGHLMLGVFYASTFPDRQEDAFTALERAVELDPNVRGKIAQHDGLDTVRSSPRFQALVS